MQEPTHAGRHADALLRDCGMCAGPPSGSGLHPDLAWARSGAMSLTGRADGPPLLAPAPLASAAQGAIEALARLAAPGGDGLARLDGAALLGERAALLGLARRGTVAPGGSCRLLRAQDGWLALNLARADDVALLPAWLEAEPGAEDPWEFSAAQVKRASATALVERARELGLPAALVRSPLLDPPPWQRWTVCGTRVERADDARPLVVDLSSLWAGPLAASLLALAGARVIKVESLERPDGARGGSPEFFSLLNGGKQNVALDFRSEQGIAQLRALLARADLVIESSRPRALVQLGVSAERVVAETPGLSWVGISGYGRREPGAHWVAFGDDAGIAAGLAGGGPDAPLFCSDAVADPLAGLHAALAALASFRRGGGELVDVSLHDVASHLLGLGRARDARVRERDGAWWVETPDGREPVVEPRARSVAQTARPLGADSESVLAELAGRC